VSAEEKAAPLPRIWLLADSPESFPEAPGEDLPNGIRIEHTAAAGAFDDLVPRVSTATAFQTIAAQTTPKDMNAVNHVVLLALIRPQRVAEPFTKSLSIAC
jgi:hypothetical protein